MFLVLLLLTETSFVVVLPQLGCEILTKKADSRELFFFLSVTFNCLLLLISHNHID